MNKKKEYIIIWGVLVALFNFICFVTPSAINGVSKYTYTFWFAYGFITASFLLHMFFSLSIKSETKTTNAFNISISVISWIELIVMVLAGGIAMTIPAIPYWTGSIVCAIILAFSIISVIVTRIVGEPVAKTNQELNIKVGLMRQMTDEAELIMKKASNNEEFEIMKAVYERFRYSDPISNCELQQDEKFINNKLREFEACVREKQNTSEIKKTADELIELIEKRNAKCKNLKRRIEA